MLAVTCLVQRKHQQFAQQAIAHGVLRRQAMHCKPTLGKSHADDAHEIQARILGRQQCAAQLLVNAAAAAALCMGQPGASCGHGPRARVNSLNWLEVCHSSRPILQRRLEIRAHVHGPSRRPQYERRHHELHIRHDGIPALQMCVW